MWVQILSSFPHYGFVLFQLWMLPLIPLNWQYTSYCVANRFTSNFGWSRQCPNRGSSTSSWYSFRRCESWGCTSCWDLYCQCQFKGIITTKVKFPTRDALLVWVQEEPRKLGFTVAIEKSGRNHRNTFITLICERGGSYIEYKKLSKCKISCSVKCECLFCLRGYLLIVGD